MNQFLSHVWGESPAADRVWSHVVGMPARLIDGESLMVLEYQAFIDDSYKIDGEFVLAGHIASVQKWAEFAREWELLLPLGTTAKGGGYHFKMAEMARSPDYSERIRPFYRLIEKTVDVSVSCRMNRAEFEAAKEKVADLFLHGAGTKVDFGIYGNPYYLLFRGILYGIAARRNEMAEEIATDSTIEFIFDNQSEKSFIIPAWDKFVSDQDDDIRPHFGTTPRFEDDRRFLPLQAADLWAWWVRKWWEDGDFTSDPDVRPALNFGTWHGKKRPILSASYSQQEMEAQLFEEAKTGLELRIKVLKEQGLL